MYVSNSTWTANIAQREADVGRARTERRPRRGRPRAAAEALRRAAPSAARRSTTRNLPSTSARGALAGAEAALASARQQLATNQSLTEGTTVEKHPSVERAAAKVREAVPRVCPRDAAGAGVGLRREAHGPGRAACRAGRAADGDHPARPGVGRREFQGSAAAPDAHRPAGDADRRRLRHRRRIPRDVAGLGVGTGSAFALLPAQNATGNWIKVVQRIPVRIAHRTVRARRCIHCASACRWRRRSTSPTPTARRSPTRRASPRLIPPPRSRTTPRMPTRWSEGPSPPTWARCRHRTARTPARGALPADAGTPHVAVRSKASAAAPL